MAASTKPEKVFHHFICLFFSWPLPFVSAPLLSSLCCVIMSSQFSVTDQTGRWRNSSFKKKKKCYLRSAVDLRHSVGKSLGTPSTLHLSILPPVHSSLHRWLPGSSAHVYADNVTGLFSHSDALGEAGWQHSQVKLHTDGLCHWLLQASPNVELFFSGSSFLARSSFFFLYGLQGNVWTPTQWTQMWVDLALPAGCA